LGQRGQGAWKGAVSSGSIERREGGVMDGGVKGSAARRWSHLRFPKEGDGGGGAGLEAAKLGGGTEKTGSRKNGGGGRRQKGGGELN
jgi:hypothetical protein